MSSVGRQRSSAKTYMRMLSTLAKTAGRGRSEEWKRLAERAAAFRKRMIYENVPKRLLSKKRAILKGLPEAERTLLVSAGKTKAGRESLKRFKSFWGLPVPPRVKKMCLPYFGKRRVTLVGMGWTPALYLAKSKSRGAKRIVLKGKWDVATDPKGKRIFYIPRGLKRCKKKADWVRVGWVKSTHYIPPKEIEDAGSFKSYAHWRHSHFDEKGKPPQAWLDRANRVFLAVGGTFSVGKWIRR